MDPTTRILFISSEIAPFLPDTEMSVFGGLLPQTVQEIGREIRAFMPRFGAVNERRNQLHEVIRLSGLNLIIDDTDHPLIIKVASMPGTRTQVYFIDNEDFFQRKDPFTNDDGTLFDDNDERSIFFVRGVLETVKKLRWKPNLIHCQGWFTFLAALFLKKAYRDDPLFARTKMVLTLSEKEAFEGTLDVRMKEKILLDGIRPKDVELLETPNYENLAKLAISHADGLLFFGKKDPALDAFAKSLKRPSLHYKKPQESIIPECNEFYSQIIRTK
jgi:starch synthase